MSSSSQPTPYLSAMAVSDEGKARISFALVALLAGGNAVGVRFSNRELAPLWGAGLRFTAAAVLLLAAMALMRLPPPRGRALAGSAVYGLFNFGASFGLAYYGLVRLHAGLAQTLLALVPLATLLLAVAQRQEHLRRAAVVGTLLALTGIALMSGLSSQKSMPFLSVLAVIGSALCIAESAVLVRAFPSVHPVTMNAVGMATGGAVLLVASAILREPLDLPHLPATWIALAYLVPLGSVAVFVLYLVILGHWSASRAAYVFVFIPVVTVLLSAWLDNEPIGPGLLLGGFLVLVGVYVGALRPARESPDPAV